MKKEKMLVKRKSTGNWSFKQIMMFGFAIIVFASIIFMQPDKTSAAKKKTKQEIRTIRKIFERLPFECCTTLNRNKYER